MDRIYLDNNATTRPLPEVVDVIRDRLLDSFANPGSRHLEGRQARKVLESAREQIAEILGADADEVVLTGGGTEASNIAILGCTTGPPGTIVLSAGEHPATTETCQFLEKQGWKLLHLDVDAEGRLLSEQYARLPWDTIHLVTLMLAHNETGVIQDLAPLGQICREKNVPFHIDAVQAVGKIPVDFHALGCTTLALGAHKFHGPRGVGALLVRQDVSLTPFQFGGHQEQGRRPGTELVALAAGMARALDTWNTERDNRAKALTNLRDRLQLGLQQRCAPATVNGSLDHRLPNTLNLSFPGPNRDAILVALDLEGVACSLGSTCASGSAEPAPALVAMNCPPDVYRSAVRFSLSYENTADEIDEAVERIARVIGRLRSMGN